MLVEVQQVVVAVQIIAEHIHTLADGDTWKHQVVDMIVVE